MKNKRKKMPVFFVTGSDNMAIHFPKFACIIEDQLCVVSFYSVVLANIFIVQIVLVDGNGTYAACLILYL